VVGRARRAGAHGGDGAPSPESVVLAEDDRHALVAAMWALPERDRLALAYRFWLGLSEAEMADVMGCARGTVKSRISRALERLRAELGAGEREEVPS
jgi:RNA polymerase sigma factor (sigma-70 family)